MSNAWKLFNTVDILCWNRKAWFSHAIFFLQLHIASLSKVFGYAKPKFISPLLLGYALHTLEEGKFFRGIP
ncbi:MULTISPECIES: hypothetical protein [Bacillus cereus group]|uniref:hypothetical protein n=1 Tax=Bacillus cereus group TaxID=86661 RepID=UPI0018DF7704|nr:hypothetical protein [Bacillus cereus]HDR4351018.1 hypothetical protein [Bacillus cereus]HDR6957962.1 hypothetical protein [Bacillus cereus]